MKKTIVSVAKDLNLAPSTVSKALNNKGYVSKETKDRILAYVEEVGYIQDASARILKSKHSYTVGVLFSDISLVGLAHPFFSQILQAFKNYVETEGYEVVFILDKIGQRKMTYLEWCKHKKVDGVFIVSGNLTNPMIIELVNSDIPCISTDFIMDKLTTVISDDYEGIKLAIEYGLSLNKKHIHFINGPLSSVAFQARQDAFIKLTQKLNIKTTISNAEGFGLNSGYKALNSLLSTDIKPDFIMVGSDDLAFGVIKALQDKGINVPNDISVMGYDDISFSSIFTPALTTIKQDKQEIGHITAQKLLSLIKNEEPKVKEVIKIPVSLIKRASTI